MEGIGYHAGACNRQTRFANDTIELMFDRVWAGNTTKYMSQSHISFFSSESPTARIPLPSKDIITDDQ